MTLEFRNQPKGGVLVKKVDAVTNAPISDVEFLVTDSDGNLCNGVLLYDDEIALGGVAELHRDNFIGLDLNRLRGIIENVACLRSPTQMARM